MPYGLSQDTLARINSVFARHTTIAKVVLYGSRAKGTQKHGSDIDISLWGAVSDKYLAQIMDALDDLNLPYMFDVSVFENIAHAPLKEHIERVGVVLYERARESIVRRNHFMKILGDVCAMNPPKKEAKEKVSGSSNVSFVPMSNLGIYSKALQINSVKTLDDAYKSYTYFAENDVLLAKITPCFENGKIGIARNLVNKIGFGSSEYIIFRSKNNTLPDYIYYFLSQKKIRSLGIKFMTGAVGHKRISEDYLQSLPIYVPPLPEQHRIVAILDDTFERIDKAIANTEKNIANAKELFEGYLSEIFYRQKKDWSRHLLGTLSQINYGYTAKARHDGAGTKYLRITDLTSDGVRWESVPTCTIDATRKKKFALLHDDIVFARTGATTGKSYHVVNPPDAVFASYLIRLTPKKDIILPYFLWLFFQTKEYWNIISEKISGSAQGGFNASKLSAMYVPTPTIDEQQALVSNATLYRDDTKKILDLYKSKLASLHALKQSLLAAAFSGELTADFNNDALDYPQKIGTL